MSGPGPTQRGTIACPKVYFLVQITGAVVGDLAFCAPIDAASVRSLKAAISFASYLDDEEVYRDGRRLVTHALAAAISDTLYSPVDGNPDVDFGLEYAYSNGQLDLTIYEELADLPEHEAQIDLSKLVAERHLWERMTTPLDYTDCDTISRFSDIDAKPTVLYQIAVLQCQRYH